jgi:hypothetical protein
MIRRWWITLSAVAVLGIAAATVSLATPSCKVCGDAHTMSVAACGQCVVELLFDLLSGW